MKKISEEPGNLIWKTLTCFHREHDPPSMIVLEPGIYEHVCPSCGRKQFVTVIKEHRL